jgi:Spy/CpxP family protein refolding chaperone
MATASTGPEHYREAQRLIAEAAHYDDIRISAEAAAVYAARAQAHAALAQVSLAIAAADPTGPVAEEWLVDVATG